MFANTLSQLHQLVCLIMMGMVLMFYSRIQRKRFFHCLVQTTKKKFQDGGFMIDWVLFVISIVVLTYLGVTLISPEKF